MIDESKKLADHLFPVKRKKDDFEILNIPPEERKLHTETYDFTVATIYESLKKNDIFIPEFQRSYVWNRSQASRFIESFVIQCPIPVIYLSQEEDERLSVIDGNQRLQSLRLFLDDAFTLRGLTTYPEIEGFYFSGLDGRIKRHILNRTLRCIAILKETHSQIKFDVFERLNTGAVQLTPQELRHGVYHSPFIEMIDELSREPIWQKVHGSKKDKRMKGAELILRFIALKEDLSSYQMPLSTFLNKFCIKAQRASNEDLLSWKSDFLSTIKHVNSFLGNYAFKTIDEKGNPHRAINAALFDAQMLAFEKRRGELNKITKKVLVAKLTNLFEEEAFYDSITAGTSSTKRVKYRIKRFLELLDEIAG